MVFSDRGKFHRFFPSFDEWGRGRKYEETPDRSGHTCPITSEVTNSYSRPARVRSESARQTRAARGATSLQYFSAVGGLHSFTEAVFFASLSLLRLVGSQHFYTLLTRL